MARGRQNVSPEEVNMTPMIDVVFQMIIFFVCTMELEKQALDESVVLPDAKSAKAVTKKVPGTVTVDVDKNGQISIGRTPLSLSTFKVVMNKTILSYGDIVPVVIRADGRTKHRSVNKVMDACKAMGLWRIKFAGLKEKAKTADEQ